MSPQGTYYCLWLLYLCLLADLSLGQDEGLCSKSFCKCPEAAKHVYCECESQLQKIDVMNGSLPRQTESLSIRNCGELTIYSNAFRSNRALQSMDLHNLNRLDLRNEFYSNREVPHAEMRNLSISSIGELRIRRGSFTNFPKSSSALIQEAGIQSLPEGSLNILTDNFVFKNNNIGVLKKSSLYSDAINLTIVYNRIELIESGAFDASVRLFNFVENTVDKVLNNGISVAFQEGVIANNTFTTQEGSPFQDVGPDPTCTADPESDYDGEENIVYNIVSNPSLFFAHNTFLNFTEDLLSFPGANNVPLGALHLEGNVVRCDCESLLTLGLSTDFDHLVTPGSGTGRGDLLFRKEFYDTGKCIQSGESRKLISLKKFMRDHIDTNTLECSDGAQSAELVGQDDMEESFQMKKKREKKPAQLLKELASSSSVISTSFYLALFSTLSHRI